MFTSFHYRLLYLFFLIWLISSCSSQETPIQARVTTVTESVYASVTIRPDSAYMAHTAVSGLVDKIFKNEGDLINRGGALLQITNTTPALNEQNAKLALEQAEENLRGSANRIKELRTEIRMSALKLQNDSINFIKQRNLWKKDIGTQNEYEARELAYQTSKNNLALLRNRLARTEKDLDTQLKQARNNYASARSSTGEYRVKSQITGRVYELFKEPGELATQQEPLALIGSATHFIIEMLIDETDITKVEKGQTVFINLDAYPDQVFEAKVSLLSPFKDESTQTFTVEAVFDSPPERLFAGLSGEANIVIKARPKALVIPASYLNAQGQVKTEDGLVTVQTGITNLNDVEIISGITANTPLYLPEK
jgi:multidrug resistance efflux pump